MILYLMAPAYITVADCERSLLYNGNSTSIIYSSEEATKLITDLLHGGAGCPLGWQSHHKYIILCTTDCVYVL